MEEKKDERNVPDQAVQTVRIICCVKMIDNLDEMVKEEFEELKNGYPDTSFVKKIINCFDEAALETALVIKDECKDKNINVKITVVTLNPGYSEHILCNFPAIGVDKVLVLQDLEQNYDFDPEKTADVLAQHIKKERDFDIILMGKQAPPFNSMLVPIYLSEEMGLPIVLDVTDIHFDKGQFHMETNDGRVLEERTAKKPFIAAVGNAKYAYLRVPTLREKLKYKSWKPEIIPLSSKQKQEKTLSFLLEQSERKCSFIEGENVGKKAEQIIELIFGVDQ